MAHFAKINLNNIVERVEVVNNNVIIENGLESEQKGINFLKSLYGQDTNWKQTSYNTKAGIYYIQDENGISSKSQDQSKAFRYNYAGIGHTWDEDLNVFIPPKPFESWILDTETYTWKSSIDMPSDHNKYEWDEIAYETDINNPKTAGWILDPKYTL